MARKYVGVKFSATDRRTYTYHDDTADAQIGDKVEVDTMRGRSTVEVVTVTEERPPFATKPILRVVARAGTVASTKGDCQ